MLKLDQINITEPNVLIAEILEPVIYTKVGNVHKTDEIVAREKDRTPYLLAKVVKAEKAIPVAGSIDLFVEPDYHVGNIIMIPRSAMQPITFPIEGYDSPKLAVISTYTIFAKIEEEVGFEHGLVRS